MSVDVNIVAVIRDHAKDLWEVFWEEFLELWALVLAAGFGLILFYSGKRY